jgi:thioredoxin-related protein
MLKRKTTHRTITLIRRGCMTLGVLLILLPFQALADNAVKWYAHDEGRVLGKIENKKMFVHFWAEWCTYCGKMEKETFGNQAVIDYLNANFIPIKINTGRERELAAQYNIRPIPDNWFLASNGDRISNQPGFIEPDMFTKILEYIHTDSYLDTSFMNFIQSRR